MTATSEYWNFMGVGTNGNRRTQKIETVKNFFLEQFPEVANLSEVSKEQEREIENYLIERWQTSAQAELCLRCFISNKIWEYCLYLEKLFGGKYGFTYKDLSPILLNDAIETNQTSSYQSLATEILTTYKLNRGGTLSGWINWIVKCHQPLKDFLLQYNLYLATDWGILNRATSSELRHLGLALAELEQDKTLLENYHAVYRQDRLRTKIRGKCQEPTLEQLQRIANISSNTEKLSPENVRKKLQNIAQNLREYRIALRGGLPPVEDIENPEINQTIEQIPDPNFGHNEQQTFLEDYTRIIQNCLHKSVSKVIENRVSQFQKLRLSKHYVFLTALRLFYEGCNMGEIAHQIGYKKQYQVSRLLKLKELREDVGQEIIVYLKPQVKELAKYYTSSENLQILEEQLNEILNEEVEKIIKNAKTESGGRKAKNGQLNSLFADAIRKYLNGIESDN